MKNTNRYQEPRELPAPTADELQIRIASTGLCGSDLHYYSHFRNGDILVREPLSLGHESAGIVTAVGSSVTSFKPGDKVALEVGLPCEKCERCEAGRYNICKDMKFRSSGKSFPHFQGTLQEQINHPAKWCYKLPDDISLDVGALLEPLGVALHAFRRSQMQKGSTVLVFGAGAVGLLCAAVAKLKEEQGDNYSGHRCRTIRLCSEEWICRHQLYSSVEERERYRREPRHCERNSGGDWKRG